MKKMLLLILCLIGSQASALTFKDCQTTYIAGGGQDWDAYTICNLVLPCVNKNNTASCNGAIDYAKKVNSTPVSHVVDNYNIS